MTPTEKVIRRYMVSPQQAAEMLGVSRGQVRRLIRSGKLPAAKLSRKTIRIKVADIESYIEAHAA